MFKVITIEREYGCGGAEIASSLAQQLGWKLWDHELTEEIAKLAHVDPSAVARCDEHMDSSFHRLAKIFWRGSYERSMPLGATEPFDTDRFVTIGKQVTEKAAHEGDCVIVGRGAPYFLREFPDVFHIFLYAPRAEKLRRLQAAGQSAEEATELVDTVDRDRMEFVKHYFNADWPTRCLYHLMINTAVGNESVVSTILKTRQILESQLVNA